MTRWWCALAVTLALALGGCSRDKGGGGSEDPSPPSVDAGTSPKPGTPGKLADVALPDLSRADEAVQVQARELHAALLEKTKSGVKGTELGDAYGELGMLLHAAEYFDSAEPCYRNAQTLTPGDARWPYYLGLLYQSRGQTS